MAEKKMTIGQQFEELYTYLVETDAPTDFIEFVDGRISQMTKANARAKELRAAKAGEKKNATQSDFYVTLREKLADVLTTELQTGGELLDQIDNMTANGKPYLAAQVATALKPLVEDGTIVVEKKKVAYENKHGLQQESLRQAYRFA